MARKGKKEMFHVTLQWEIPNSPYNEKSWHNFLHLITLADKVFRGKVLIRIHMIGRYNNFKGIHIMLPN